MITHSLRHTTHRIAPPRSPHRLLSLAAAVMGVLISVWGLGGPAQAAPRPATLAAAIPSTTNYPWNGLSSGADGWGMGYGQCVSFVAWMIYQNNGGIQHPASVPARGWFPSDGLANSPVRDGWGNAGDWSRTAAAANYAVNGTAHVGAVAQWDNGSDGGQFTVGHVAYVTAVNADGSIDVAQFNLREDSRYSTLHMPRSGATDTSNGHGAFYVPWPDHFIHVGDGDVGGTLYHVTGTDANGLAVQSQPRVNHVITFVTNGTTLHVSCQTKYGDQVDNHTQYGRPFTTWDRLTDGTWVYDWYLDTPTVGADGYSPGIPHCSGG